MFCFFVGDEVLFDEVVVCFGICIGVFDFEGYDFFVWVYVQVFMVLWQYGMYGVVWYVDMVGLSIFIVFVIDEVWLVVEL